MRIIFLDIDGVVLPFGSISDLDVGLVRSNPLAHLDVLVKNTPPEPAAALAGLAIGAEAKFVLISSWRKAFPATFVKAYLKRVGLGKYMHRDWTAEWKLSSSKGHDIGWWLGDHPKVKQKDCIVIDDEDLDLRERWGFRQLKHLQPDPKRGFSTSLMHSALDSWGLLR